MCAIWVTLGPRAVIIYFKFIFLINVASAGAVIDVSPLVGMFNDQKSPWRAIIQLILLLPGIAESTMSQRQVHVHLFKLRLNDGVSELSGIFFFFVLKAFTSSPTAATIWDIPTMSLFFQ